MSLHDAAHAPNCRLGVDEERKKHERLFLPLVMESVDRGLEENQDEAPIYDYTMWLCS